LSLKVLAAAKTPETQPPVATELLELLLEELLLEDEPPDGVPLYEPPPPPPPQADRTAIAATAMQRCAILNMFSPRSNAAV
jgi:hypothetical protein